MLEINPGPVYNASNINLHAAVPTDTFGKRGIDFSTQYFDDVHGIDGEQQILTNFVELGQLNNIWSQYICREITMWTRRKAAIPPCSPTMSKALTEPASASFTRDVSSMLLQV